jgi:uncharacterized protein (TIGR00255 family)
MKSMTGYGQHSTEIGGRSITVEVRTVNHKYSEISVRVPRAYGFLEEKLKSRAALTISRGKADINVNINSVSVPDIKVSLNEPVVAAYIGALRSETRLRDDLALSDLLRIPDAIAIEKPEIDIEAFTLDVISVADVAFENLSKMRQNEGERLKADILSRLDTIEEAAKEIDILSPDTTSKYREKLTERLKDVLSDKNIDESRILTEAAIFAEKTAVSEETVRLFAHIAQYREFLSADSPIGRKADFLTQEMNREANTIGSKCQDLRITKIIIECKSEIEKIREQIQNAE